MKNIYTALAQFHAEMPDIKKSGDNPFFKSKYAPLESILPAIEPVMKKWGLSFTQIPVGDCELETIIFHAESGESISGKTNMILSKQDIQGQGAAITYMRRFALVSMLGLNAVDDTDGEDAVKREKPKAKPKGYVEELGF